MKKITTPFLLLALAAPAAFAGNYATCLLDKLEGVQNDLIAQSAMRLCASEHPGGFAGVEQGAGRGILGYDSGDECAVDKARDTQSRLAAGQLRRACGRLYDSPADAAARIGLKPFNGPYTPVQRLVPFNGELDEQP
ncbi:hypothetical protein [Halopseudomonas aestusnigri]|uniref:hypothetical protein n=1 Tax=Halopseudomonas aestusnigri TaxID=857252 RepID=UPI00300177F4